MPRWTVGGFQIVERLADHPPRHVHVFKDARFVGRVAVETGEWIEGPCHAEAQAREAVRRWREENRL